MLSNKAIDEKKHGGKTNLKLALQIIGCGLLLSSPFWVPFAYLGFFWKLGLLTDSQFVLVIWTINFFAMILLWTTPFIATIPIVINKKIPIWVKIFAVPIYILIGAFVIFFSAWGACSVFIGHCY